MSEYAVLLRGSRLVLPGTNENGELVDVSTWEDAEDNLDAFAAALYGQEQPKRTRTSAVLVHRADNTYNGNAISVSTPAADGGSLDERHLGYLYDHFLHKVGMSNLPDLIRFAGGEVECTVVLEDAFELFVDLPEPRILGEAIRTFLGARGIEASGPQRPGDAEPELNNHTSRNGATTRALRLLALYEHDVLPVTGLSLSTLQYGGVPGRSLLLRDEVTGRRLGILANGWLRLNDERDRDAVLALLEHQGIPVNRAVSNPTVEEDGTWPTELAPNLEHRVRAGGLDLRTSEQPSDETFAIFNPTSDVLWVEDSRLVAPALRHLHRQGFDVGRVGLPRRPWGLENEIPYHSLRDPHKPWRDETDWHRPSLLPTTRPLIPSGILSANDVKWVAPNKQGPAPDPSFILLERHVPERWTLFPAHTLTGDIGHCRLCGSYAASFTTPVATEVVSYCHPCLVHAATGLVTDRTRAGVALRALSDLEFDGHPMLATQLESIHANPAAPVDAASIDRMVLLRFGITRKGVAWTRLLEAAGFAEHGLRTGRGTLIRSRDGHLCLSLRERVVCDFLHQHDIQHDREPLYPADPDYNRHGLRRADWLLPDGTLVELWGLPNDPQYAQKMTEKRMLAERHGLRLLEITDHNLPRLREVFEPWLPRGLKSPWQWSPQLVAAPAREPAQKKAARGDGRGRNAFNTQIQQIRVARCAEALRLQRSGLTRAQVGQQLGVGPDAVKMLLRDGKFYAYPASDAGRAELARSAAQARERGLTRAQFQGEATISQPKAQQAWRDAAILVEKSTQGVGD